MKTNQIKSEKEKKSMENAKVTKKEVLNAIVEAVVAGVVDFGAITEGKISNDAVQAFAENEIGLLEKKAAKAKAKAAEKKAEADELQVAVQAALTDEFAPIADIAARIEGEDVTVSKVTYRLTQLVKAGIAEKEEIKVSAEGEKTRKIMGYRLAGAAEAEIADVE